MPPLPLIYNRQSIRLQGFDYSKPGYYFVTLCVKDRENYFGEINENKQIIISEIGKAVHECWNEIPKHFPHVRLDEFIIMPNHIHGIIEITRYPNHFQPQNENSGIEKNHEVDQNFVDHHAGVQNFEPLHENDSKMTNLHGEVHPGEVHPGEVHPGEVHSGEVHSGEVHSGEVHSGEVHPGEVQNFEPLQDDSSSHLNPINNFLLRIDSNENERINRFQKIIPGSLGSIIRGFKTGVTKWCNQNGYEDFKWQRNFHEVIIRDENHLNNVRNYIKNNPKNWDDDENNYINYFLNIKEKKYE